MHVLLISQNFSPEITSCALRMDSFVEAWTEMGHRVTVLTAVPNHPEGVVRPQYRGRAVVRERRAGADVRRVWMYARPGKRSRDRLVGYATFTGMATLAGLRISPAPDVVVATSPPPFTGLAGAALAARYRVPFVFDVRDLWPDAAVALGELRPGPAVTAVGRMVAWLYRRADLVVAATTGFAAEIGNGAQVIDNGVDPRVAAATPADGARVRRELGLGDEYVVGFVGNHGVCEALENVVEAAAIAGPRSMRLLLVGDGLRREELIAQAAAAGASNVMFQPAVEVERVGAFMHAADVLLVSLHDIAHFATRLPAKLFDAWACGKPVLVAYDGDARRLAEELGAGTYASSADPQALAAEMVRLGEVGAVERARMGDAGRRWVRRERDRASSARKLGGLLEKLVQEGRRR